MARAEGEVTGRLNCNPTLGARAFYRGAADEQLAYIRRSGLSFVGNEGPLPTELPPPSELRAGSHVNSSRLGGVSSLASAGGVCVRTSGGAPGTPGLATVPVMPT